ncbi:DDE-type integrase/transposase/recombinase [Desulforhabdus amnigena]|jgi:transposase InsO family protein|uniref:Transposase n=1 Tax=Desulforhabdus amnigena TaxID=40218 RepID=A0A9W6CYG1_9BACT|nr:DDE-type integrase/transposase/recombinase [Desulforhabdus amnigena]GLI32569.1 transposase [Desulforhabdus amnigena]GLI34126.1 transposase [Desulforhabdus amnigena]
MDEQQQKDVAVFRFGVISDFVTRNAMDRGEQERLLTEKCEQSWQIPHSNRSRLARSTILGWIKAYRQGGGRLESLYPGSRNDRGVSRIIDEETGGLIARLRAGMPKCSLPTLIKELEKRKLLPAGMVLSESTLYRFLKREGLLKAAPPPAVDRRKFEAELPNDLWQSDALHGPLVMVGEKRRKTYLFAFIDDMSRLVPHAAFFLNENLDSYLCALRRALLKRGLPRKLYVDNGAAFRSRLLHEITASLGIALVHSKPYKPQGRGKVERFFQTVRAQFLASVEADSLEALNEQFDQWVTTVYHQRPHGGTGEPPLKRFADHMECIRPAPKYLEDYFRKRARRKVANDRTVSLNGRLYEASVALIGSQVTLLYNEDDPTRVEVQLGGQSHGFLTPLDLNVNCRVRRNHSTGLVIENTGKPAISSGRLSFSNREDQ